MEWMITFMGWFLVAVGILKVLDWDRFTKNFRKYDLIAMKNKTYSNIYPILEIMIGIALGTVAQSFRIITGREKSILGD